MKINLRRLGIWNVDLSCPPPLYRATHNGKEIFFHAEYRFGMYFRIKSISYGGKTYTADRYQYKFIPLVRELVFEIWKSEGLYDYGKNEFVNYEDIHKNIKTISTGQKSETMSQFLGRKLLPRI